MPMCCWTAQQEKGHIEELKAFLSGSLTERNLNCADAFGRDWYEANSIADFLSIGNVIMTTWADSLPRNSSCTCPDFWRPFCNKTNPGQCAAYSCQDMKAYCKEQSDAGMQTRMHCPESCGCSSFASPVVPISGCLSACRRKESFQQQRKQRPCADAQPGSPELMAYGAGLDALGTFSASHGANHYYHLARDHGCVEWVSALGNWKV